MAIRSARWLIWATGVLLVFVALVAAVTSRTSSLRERLIVTLEERLDSEVELASFAVDTFPRVAITGGDLTIRKKGSDGPPLIRIKSFSVEGGLLGLLRVHRRFSVVHLDGLVVTITPHQNRQEEDDEYEGRDERPSHISIDRVLAHNARLVIVPRRADKEPKVFDIHDLTMSEAGFNRAMPFEALLTNPVPKGRIAVNGTFGPWHGRAPAKTPLSGRYRFRQADLSTIDGISGTLDSDGEFDGTLKRIAVRGTTNTPDFAVDVGAGPLRLVTRFDAIVDGTDGDTYLNRVDARFGNTSLTARGAITGTRGVKGRTITLDVTMDRGRIEDTLRLAVDAREPLMRGDLQLRTSLLLPPGRAPISERLQLAGTFALSQGEFNDGKLQRRLVLLSRRGRGVNGEKSAAGEVVSGLRGQFRLRHGVLEFPSLTFGVPGAEVRIAGRYGLRTQALDFLGQLRMEATVSRAMGGGVKGFFLKPFDPLFRRDGAGAVVPIKIAGTRTEPKFGLDYRRVIRP